MTGAVHPVDAAADPDPLKGGDVYRWAMEQAALIRAGRFDEVDILNVADEIESVGNSEFRALASNLEIVLTHLLKWDHQPGRRTRSWINSIEEHRERIRSDLSESPSLKSRRREAIDRGYRHARRVAASQTKLSLKNFPEDCSYSWETIMERAFSLGTDGGVE